MFFMGIFSSIKKFFGFSTTKGHNTQSRSRSSKLHRRSKHWTNNGKNQYLIEFRFIDPTLKRKIKQLEYEIYRKFGVGQQHFVPHISLVGGFQTNDEKRLVHTFYHECSNAPQMKFHVKGFSVFEDPKRVIFLDIVPSEELQQFRYDLSQHLQSFCSLNKHDFGKKDEFVFHSTLSLNVPPNKFEKIRDYLNEKPFAIEDHYVTRVTLLKNRFILREYDFLQKKMLLRHEAKDPHHYAITENLLKDRLCRIPL